MEETLEQKATLVTAQIIAWARSHKIGPDASHLTKKVIRLAYSEFGRGYDDGMSIGIKQTNEAWIKMPQERRNLLAEELKTLKNKHHGRN